MNSSNNTEYLQRSFGGDPSGNEIIHTERIDVSQVDRGKGFWRMVTETICDVSVYGDVQEGETKGEDGLHHDWSDPGSLIVQCDTEAKESHCSKDECENYGNETEFRFVDTVVATGQEFAEVIIDRTCDEANEGSNQACNTQ